MEKRPLRYKRKQILPAPRPPVVPLFGLGNKEKNCYNVTENETVFSTTCEYILNVIFSILFYYENLITICIL